MKIGITGGDGFIGQHLRFFLLPLEKEGAVEVCLFPKHSFADGTLETLLADCDAIVHLAGKNRGEDSEMYDTNLSLARTLIEACDAATVRPHIVFASSLHRERDSAYGRSKRDAERLFVEWGARTGAPVAIMILPNVFGPFCKPFYNSAVATLCHELAEGVDSTINDGAQVELLHAHDVARAFYESIVEKTEGEIILSGTHMSLADVYAFLAQAYEQYQSNVIPKLSSTIEQQLFGTLQVYVFDKQFPRVLNVKDDPRGPIFEIIRGNGSGQVFFSTTHPGKTRGNHYHTRKFERFCVVQGDGEIAIRKLFDTKVKRFPVSGSEPTVVDMPQFYAHNITNVGDGDLLVAFWISEHYNESDPDTYYETV